MRSFTLALCLGLLTACGPKAAPVQAAASTPATFAGVLGTVESTAVADLPTRVEAQLTGLLTARNLVPSAVPAERWGPVFDKRRTTPQRMEWLATIAGGGQLIVLVETEVSFYAQLSGRYRWTVDVTATVAPAGDVEAGVTESFSVPVFLLYDHEREAEALTEASQQISRKVGGLLDDYLGGLE